MKAICVFSGGLDSMLAAELIRDQGHDVLAFFFETPFFNHHKAKSSAQALGLPLKIVDISKRHVAMVKAPKYGYGAHMNPCIDCHALMIRTAGEMLLREGADFIITGEVLGQRPMSQNKRSLALVADESGFGNLVIRPLSAKYLPLTVPERKGWVNRDLLPAIQGRSRKPQMALAASLGIKTYPAPAGGCLLTEKAFSRRLKDLFNARTGTKMKEIEALKVGRHFRISPAAKLVVGRNKRENEVLQSLAGENDLLLTALGVPGPTILGTGEFDAKSFTTAGAITAAYSDVQEGEKTTIKIIKNGMETTMTSRSENKARFKGAMI